MTSTFDTRHRSFSFGAGLLFTLTVALIAGCGDDGSDSGAGGTDSGPTEAFVASQRVFLPDGRFVLLHLLSDLERQQLNVDEGFEFSGFSRVRAFNGKVFVFESESGQVIRFGVTPSLQLEEEARLSMTNQGVRSFNDTTTFVSPARAFYFDFSGQMIVFDPEAMEIVQTIEGPDMQREGFPGPRFSPPVRVGDELYVSLAWANTDTIDLIPALTVAVFSISEERLLRVVEDGRCAYGHRGFAHEGAFYLVGDASEGAGNLISDEVPPPCLLRIREGEEQFDPDFYVDLTEPTGRPLVANGPVGIGDGRFLNMVYDSPIDPDSFDPNNVSDLIEFANGQLWRWAVLSLPDGETTLLEGTPLTGTNPFDAFLVDDTSYVPILAGDGSSSQVFRIDNLEDGSTTLTLESTSGEILTVERVF